MLPSTAFRRGGSIRKQACEGTLAIGCNGDCVSNTRTLGTFSKKQKDAICRFSHPGGQKGQKTRSRAPLSRPGRRSVASSRKFYASTFSKRRQASERQGWAVIPQTSMVPPHRAGPLANGAENLSSSTPRPQLGLSEWPIHENQRYPHTRLLCSAPVPERSFAPRQWFPDLQDQLTTNRVGKPPHLVSGGGLGELGGLGM